MASKLTDLDAGERELLLKFVCAFAWADLEIQDQERDFVAKLILQMGLGDAEKKKVEGWLKLPPKPDEVDPQRVPRAHRKLFIECAKEMISADGVIDEAEAENFELLEQLLS